MKNENFLKFSFSKKQTKIKIKKVFVVALIGFSTYDNHLPASQYLIQQTSYRALELLYCTFVLFVLRVPPEIARRANYTQLNH